MNIKEFYNYLVNFNHIIGFLISLVQIGLINKNGGMMIDEFGYNYFSPNIVPMIFVVMTFLKYGEDFFNSTISLIEYINCNYRNRKCENRIKNSSDSLKYSVVNDFNKQIKKLVKYKKRYFIRNSRVQHEFVMGLLILLKKCKNMIEFKNSKSLVLEKNENIKRKDTHFRKIKSLSKSSSDLSDNVNELEGNIIKSNTSNLLFKWNYLREFISSANFSNKIGKKSRKNLMSNSTETNEKINRDKYFENKDYINLNHKMNNPLSIESKKELYNKEMITFLSNSNLEKLFFKAPLPEVFNSLVSSEKVISIINSLKTNFYKKFIKNSEIKILPNNCICKSKNEDFLLNNSDDAIIVMKGSIKLNHFDKLVKEYTADTESCILYGIKKNYNMKIVTSSDFTIIFHIKNLIPILLETGIKLMNILKENITNPMILSENNFNNFRNYILNKANAIRKSKKICNDKFNHYYSFQKIIFNCISKEVIGYNIECKNNDNINLKIVNEDEVNLNKNSSYAEINSKINSKAEDSDIKTIDQLKDSKNLLLKIKNNQSVFLQKFDQIKNSIIMEIRAKINKDEVIFKDFVIKNRKINGYLKKKKICRLDFENANYKPIFKEDFQNINYDNFREEDYIKTITVIHLINNNFQQNSTSEICIKTVEGFNLV